ncbi:MAG TPA: hypothetical protein VOB72_22595 [Candidatus Dormibacteraeota bacterium]|nr:hypothetical protein [Candidatus Dormibacteraeota bacterium]
MVTVEATPEASGWRCAVEVGGAPSRHTVHVRAEDLERWGRTGETPEQLVARAFDFLLAREPASSILRSFALTDITRYFPEFDREIRR